MSRVTNAAAVVLIVGAVASAFDSEEKRTISWNFNVPPSEKVDSLHMKIFDLGNNIVFDDSVAVYGINSNIPVPVITIGKSNFNVETYGVGDRAKIKVNTQHSQDISVEIFDLLGRRISSSMENVRHGTNEFDLDLSSYSASQYLLRIGAKEGFATSKIVNVGSEKKVGKAIVNDLESRIKSGSIDEWKFVISHPKLFTDSFYVTPSSYMTLNGTLRSRPNITGQVLDVFNMVGEDGNRKIVDGRFIPEVGIDGMKVFLSSDTANNVVTSNGGYFSLRPHLIEGTLDTLYIINHLNNTKYYQTVRPLAVKTGEILDVNGRPSALITFPQGITEGVNNANMPISMDNLEFLRFTIEIERMIYPNYTEYNGSILNINLLKRPAKVYLDRENAKEQSNPLEPYYTAKQYSDTIMWGLKRHEVVSGIKFVETSNKSEADIEYIMFDNIDYSKDHYMHIETDGSVKTEEGRNLQKIRVYLQNGRGCNYIAWVSAHEITHMIARNTDEGHSPFQYDTYGVGWRLLDEFGRHKLSERDIMINKLCLWPMANPNYSFLRKEIK